MKPPYVLLACSGLDHAHRGFETFARECFEALREDPAMRIELVKGSGPPGPGERSVPTLTRDHPLVRALGRRLGQEPFRLEAFAFGVAIAPLVLRRSPDIIYLSEWDTARVVAALRSRTRARFKVLLSNGGFASSGFEYLDHVQQLTPAALEYVLARGADPRRHTVLPLGFEIEAELRPLGPEERAALRRRLRLPQGRMVIVSVAALNRRHKRIDYLIEEVARLPQPRPYLLLVGVREPGTAELERLALRRLGEGHFDFRTVPPAEVPDILRASDLFVLASLVEAQGRSLIEAAAAGITCVVHDNPVTDYALGEHGIFGDLSRPGALTALLLGLAAEDPDAASRRTLAAHRHVYERFSWNRLRPRYVELLTELACDGVPVARVGAQRARSSSPHSEPTTRAP